MGPVQMLVLGFEGDHFTGEILPELRRLKDADVIRMIDMLFVRKDADGEVDACTSAISPPRRRGVRRARRRPDRPRRRRRGGPRGRGRARRGRPRGRPRDQRRRGLARRRRDPARQRGGDRADRASLGDPVPRRGGRARAASRSPTSGSTPPTWSPRARRSRPSETETRAGRERARPASSQYALRRCPAVGGEAVDDEDVDGEDRQRPERIAGQRQQRGDRVEARCGDAEPAAERAAVPDRERGDDLQHADGQRHPAPGAEVSISFVIGGATSKIVRSAGRLLNVAGTRPVPGARLPGVSAPRRRG